MSARKLVLILVLLVFLLLIAYLVNTTSRVSLECKDYPRIIEPNSTIILSCKLNREAEVYVEVKTPKGNYERWNYRVEENFQLELNVTGEGAYKILVCAKSWRGISCWNGSLLAVHKPDLLVEAYPIIENGLVRIRVKFKDSRKISNAFLIINKRIIYGVSREDSYEFNISIFESNAAIVAVDEYGFEVRKRLELEKLKKYLLFQFAQEHGLDIQILNSLYNISPENTLCSLINKPRYLIAAVNYVKKYGASINQAARILNPNVLKVAILAEIEAYKKEHARYGLELAKELSAKNLPYSVAYYPTNTLLMPFKTLQPIIYSADEVLSYTYSHASLLKIPSWLIRAEIITANEFFYDENVSFNDAVLVAPWGEVNTTVLDILEEMGIHTVITPFSEKLDLYKYRDITVVTVPRFPQIGSKEDVVFIDFSLENLGYEENRVLMWKIIEDLESGIFLDKQAIVVPMEVFLNITESYVLEVGNISQERLHKVPGSLWFKYSKLLKEADYLLEYAYKTRGDIALSSWSIPICEAIDTWVFWIDYNLSSEEISEYLKSEEETIKRLGLALNEYKKRAKIVRSWVLWLQNVNYTVLLSLPVDLVVIDPDDTGFNAEQIFEIKSSEKIVLAYLSIGEAEDYRSYWRREWYINPPEWLGEENPQWEGCYKVKYWYPEWQEIVFDRLEEIIRLGYDGVYLDVVDAYEYWQERGYTDAREDMIRLVISISEKAKKENTYFLIIPQNALELVENRDYLKAIDGVGKEDTWFLINEPRPEAFIQKDLDYLEIIAKNWKIVLLIDYPTELKKIRKFFNNALKYGYAAYVGPLELDRVGFYKPP